MSTDNTTPENDKLAAERASRIRALESEKAQALRTIEKAQNKLQIIEEQLAALKKEGN